MSCVSIAPEILLMREVWDCLNPLGFEAGVYTTYRTYIDESGDGKQVFTLSGLMAKGSNWQWIAIDWKEILEEKNKELAKQGRKTLRRFHAKDMNNFVEDFEGWLPDERTEFSKKLIHIFDKPSNRVNGFSESIELQTLKRLIPETKDDPIGFSYHFLLKMMMHGIGEKFAEANDGQVPPNIRVALIHDQTTKYNGVLAETFASFLKDPTFKYPSLFTTIAPMKCQDCIALQPADLLASENFKETLRHASDKEKDQKRDRRISLDALLNCQSFGGYGRCLGENAILELRKMMDENVARIIKAQSVINSNDDANAEGKTPQ